METRIVSNETFKYMFKTTVKVDEYTVDSFTYCNLEGNDIVATTYMKLQETETLIPINKTRRLKGMNSLNAMELFAKSIALVFAPKALPELIYQRELQFKASILDFNGELESIDKIADELQRKELKEIFIKLKRGDAK